MSERKRKPYFKATYLVTNTPTLAGMKSAMTSGGSVNLLGAKRIEFLFDGTQTKADLNTGQWYDFGKLTISGGTKYWLRVWLTNATKEFEVDIWDEGKTGSLWATGTGVRTSWDNDSKFFIWIDNIGVTNDLTGFCNSVTDCQDYEEDSTLTAIDFQLIDFAGTELNANHLIDYGHDTCIDIGCGLCP